MRGAQARRRSIEPGATTISRSGGRRPALTTRRSQRPWRGTRLWQRGVRRVSMPIASCVGGRTVMRPALTYDSAPGYADPVVLGYLGRRQRPVVRGDLVEAAVVPQPG